MKRIIIFTIISYAIVLSANAQDSKTTNEIGVVFSSLNSFGVSYKHGNTTLLRLSL